jgi:mono/diheme cytochrome c family protein
MEKLMQRRAILCCVAGIAACLGISAVAQDQHHAKGSTAPAIAAASSESTGDDAAKASATTDKEKAAIESGLRIEGEKSFRTNCGRCHMAPHKFPPRVMATAIRHMRVRATLTDEDMRLILHYMTQ